MKPQKKLHLTAYILFLFSIAIPNPIHAEIAFQLVNGGPFTWDEAVQDAVLRGGHLATIPTEEKWHKIQTQVGSEISGKVIWIGASDISGGGTWQWVTGEPWGFVNWAPGEPNGTSGGCPSDYLELNPNGSWNDTCNTTIRELYLLEFNDTTPRAAKATLQIINGFIVGVQLIDGGNGYIAAPAVSFVSDVGTGASATALITNGVVAEVKLMNAGTGYGPTTIVLIAPPPFAPQLSIRVSKIAVDMKLTLGRKYQLESSNDLKIWTTAGNPLDPQSEEVSLEFPIDDVGRFFRARQLP